MEKRDLNISNSINLGIQRECNFIKITNLDEFLEDNVSNLESHKRPFKILQELENLVLFENTPEEVYLIEYKKSEGYCIFNLIDITDYDSKRCVIFEYAGVVS